MKRYSSLRFDITDDITQRLTVAKQTYVDARTQKRSDEYPDDLFVVVLNNANEVDLVLEASLKQILQLGKEIEYLRKEVEKQDG